MTLKGMPGTALKHILESIGIFPTGGCPCADIARQMDNWGVEGCELRRSRIAISLRENHRKRGWPETWIAMVSVVTTGLAAKVLRYPLNPYLGLVEEAIEQAPKFTVSDVVSQPRMTRYQSQNLPDHTAILTPIPADISDVRNLIYHIWPNSKTDNWRWNVRQLLNRIDLFNGVRSIGVVVDGETVSLTEVQAEFGDTRIDNWIERQNNPKRREGATFLDLMETLPRDNSVTCYAHAKGVRHHTGSLTIDWADMLYRSTMENWPRIRDQLEQFPVTGAFKRYGTFRIPNNHHWHYSGTFFWFRNQDTFSRESWRFLHPNFFACVEAWPANIYTSTEAACLFGDNAGDLYKPNELAKHSAALTAMESQCSELR